MKRGSPDSRRTARRHGDGEGVQPSRFPRHVGIIMEGNGRWAEERVLPRTAGHLEGVRAARRVVQAAADAGLGFLSLYTFSNEKWARPEEEISYLMFLIRTTLAKERDFYRTNGIRVVHSGDVTRLPPDLQVEIRSITEDTARFGGLTVNLAINYGGRDEIVRALRRARERGGNGSLTEEAFRAYLDRPEIPDPDLIIRTGNERRLSDFLLWESAYAELYFSPLLWPDWGAENLREALQDYAGRSRRFGGSP